MVWRFKTYVLSSFCLLVLSLTHFERKNDFRGNSDSSQFISIKYVEDHLHTGTRSKIQNTDDLDLIQDGIFWSEYAESFVPKGLLHNDSIELVKCLRRQHVEKIKHASQSVCGSGKNGIVDFEDGTTMCARYEKNYHLIYAEALAFYLSRLLRMDNVPEVILSRLNGSSKQWRGADFHKMNWDEDVEVAMIKFLHNASFETFMPLVIQNAYKSGNPVDSDVIRYTSPLLRSTNIAELIQWGTMIIFDNLIGHYDRLILYQPVGDHEIRKRSIYSGLFNSLKSPNGKIWLIDNESAFFYQNRFRDPTYNYNQLIKFHDVMLKTMCIFQSSLVDELRKLSKHPSAFHHLWEYASSYEPLFATFLKDYRFQVFAKLFNKRLQDIIGWITYCKYLSTEKYVPKP